jgi:hypothetical protein
MLFKTEPGVSLVGAGFGPKPKSGVQGKAEYEERYGYSFCSHITFNDLSEGARKPSSPGQPGESSSPSKIPAALIFLQSGMELDAAGKGGSRQDSRLPFDRPLVLKFAEEHQLFLMTHLLGSCR